MSKKVEKIEVEIDTLEVIAKYYEFPLDVFFAPKSAWRKGDTRLNDLRKVAEKYQKIKDIIDEEEDG